MNMLPEKIMRLLKMFTPPRTRLRSDPRRIAVAIPTHNRAARVLRLVRRMMSDPRIGEIIVRDDASDPADFDRLAAGLGQLGPRVRLHRNASNLGAFGNKLAVVGDCRLDWALLLDSDNQFGPDYLDRFYALPAWSERVIYCPQRARPRFDFTFLAGTAMDIKAAPALFTPAWKDPMCVFLNTGNYIVPAGPYVAGLAPYASRNVGGADVFFANLVWLQGGGLLYVVPGMEYDHDVHDGSWFKETAAQSKPLVRQMQHALESGNPAAVPAVLATMGAGMSNQSTQQNETTG